MKLLGKAHDAAFWQLVKEKDIFENYRKRLHNYWEKTGENFEIKALTYSKWKMFWETGDRSMYQNDFFDRRRALESITPLALMYPEEKKYIDKIMDVVFAICDEYTWCLPAHQGQNEKNDNTRIDLFAAETGFYLAILYTLLGDRFDPVINDRIRVEIERRIVTPFLATDNYGWWEVGNNNWVAVCVGSVGCTFMLMRPDLMTDKLESRLLKAMQRFIDGFEDDGICTEGCGYWAYGVSFFVQFADMIKIFTNGRIDCFKDPKVKSIATFPQKMFLSGKAAVSFADGSRTLEYTFGVMHRLKAEYPDDVLIYSPEYGNFDMGCGRLCIRLYAATWMNEEYYKNPADNSTAFESYAPNAQWLTKRTASYGFAAKGGHNGEMHNHNDVGSFIFAKNGRQLLVDVGSGLYTRQYFSDERYEIFEPSSRSHNVPVVNGEYQLPGRDYSATDVVYTPGSFSMNIAGAYEKGLMSSIFRRFDMTDEKVVLTDTYVRGNAKEIVERFVSDIKPEIVSDSLIKIGDCELCFDPSLATVSINTQEGSANSNVVYYLIDFRVNNDVDKFCIEMK